MSAATAGGGVRLLANGNRVPVLGLGVWQVPDGRECVEVVRWALDTARELGLARSIGVSDTSAAELYAVIDAGTVPPPSTRSSSTRGTARKQIAELQAKAGPASWTVTAGAC